MRNFTYLRPTEQAAAIAAAAQPDTRILAGGTTLLDLMKCGVDSPGRLIDITALPGLDRIEADRSRLRIGALAKMSDVADHPAVVDGWPAISQSLWRAASAQIRNMATIGGNLMQRTRCPYFRDPAGFTACNKRAPGSGCAARDGENRMHAVLGGSEQCIATYPGDLAVALTAFDATVELRGPHGQRRIPVGEFFLLPGHTPWIEHPLASGELIVAVEIAASPAARRSHYLKVRDRASYEFAAASAAVGLATESDVIRDIRVALGGVATKPWRARGVEARLIGRKLEPRLVREAAALAADGAVPGAHNAYKIPLIQRTVARALTIAGEVA